MRLAQQINGNMKDNGQMDVVLGGKAVTMNVNNEVDTNADAKAFEADMEAKRNGKEVAIQQAYQRGLEIKEKMKNMEIVPNGEYLLVQPYEDNPYQTLEINQSGLVIPNWDGSFKNPDTGEQDKEQSFIKVANVIEVGPKVKYVQAGDDIYYTRASELPVPFFHKGFAIVPETRVMVIINENVKERMEAINNG